MKTEDDDNSLFIHNIDERISSEVNTTLQQNERWQTEDLDFFTNQTHDNPFTTIAIKWLQVEI
jgi:hypothetical protein